MNSDVRGVMDRSDPHHGAVDDGLYATCRRSHTAQQLLPNRGKMRRSTVLFSMLLICFKCGGAFIPNSYRALHSAKSRSKETVSRLWEQQENKNPFSFFLNPYESKIPKEIEKEIYEAEGNTAAAKDRGQRVALYAGIAFVGVLCAFFNGFLTELRNAPEGITLEDAGFGWVESNFLLKFLFLNKIGGWICLLGGAGSGLLAEAEYDTRRTNAEKIWEELQKRREAKEKKDQTSKSKKKKRRSGKEMKRIGALSEVLEVENTAANSLGGEAPTDEKEDVPQDEETKEKEQEKKAGGVLDVFKEYYQKADTLAASQALLLNKKLEEQGLLEKITDETGLRVVGREEATRIQQEKEKQQTKDEINKQ